MATVDNITASAGTTVPEQPRPPINWQACSDPAHPDHVLYQLALLQVQARDYHDDCEQVYFRHNGVAPIHYLAERVTDHWGDRMEVLRQAVLSIRPKSLEGAVITLRYALESIRVYQDNRDHEAEGRRTEAAIHAVLDVMQQVGTTEVEGRQPWANPVDVFEMAERYRDRNPS